MCCTGRGSRQCRGRFKKRVILKVLLGLPASHEPLASVPCYVPVFCSKCEAPCPVTGEAASQLMHRTCTYRQALF